MNLTWGEIQITSIQKMFLNNTIVSVADLPTMKTDNKYKIYFNAMPQAANEGLMLLMKKSRPHFKQYKFTQFPIVNLLGDTTRVCQHTTEDISFITDKGLSYYFEVDNAATVEIYVSGVLKTTINNVTSNPGTFTSYKGFLDNSANDSVEIIFKGSHPYNYKNVAVYELDYQYVEGITSTIPAFGTVTDYQLPSDLYKIENVLFDDGINGPVMNTDYKYNSGDYKISIDNDKIGTFTINYQCYPTKITSATADSFQIEMEPEVLSLLPLYIVSELYLDDDISLSTQYRNKFEMDLSNIYPSGTHEEFTSNSGWL